MRQAYSGQQNYRPQENQGDFNQGGMTTHQNDSERLEGLKRNLERIEQQLGQNQLKQPFPPYAQANSDYGDPMNHGLHSNNPTHMMHNGPETQINMLRDQLDKLSAQSYGQQNTSHHTAAMDSAGANSNSATLEIMRRQQALNAPHPMPPQNLSVQSQMGFGQAGGQTTSGQASGQNAAINSQQQKQMRALMQESMGQISRQMNGLRKELTDLKAEVAKPVAVQQEVPQSEIDRIAHAVSALQNNQTFDEVAFQRLTDEINTLRAHMKQDFQVSMQEHQNAVADPFAQGVSQRVDGLAAQLENMTKTVNAVSMHAAERVVPRVDSLSQQLDSLRTSVHELPQTLSVGRLEERLDDVSAKMNDLALITQDQMVLQSQGVTSQDVVSIERRLDEISRALVAVSSLNKKPLAVDLSAIDRVEARMSALAQTVDSLAQRDNHQAFDKMSTRIEGLTERLGSFEKYAQTGDLGAANAVFAAPDTKVIENQLSHLSAMIENVSSQSQTSELEQQVAQLSARVEEAASAHSTAAQMNNLEQQIGLIVDHMNSKDGDTQAPVVDFSPIEERFTDIENQLVETRSFSLEAAQMAAQKAVDMIGSHSEMGQIVQELSQNLNSLQSASENNSTQNTQTVAQVHDVLAQVVDRLGAIEGAIEGAAQQPNYDQVVANAPQMSQAIDAGYDNAQQGAAASFASTAAQEFDHQHAATVQNVAQEVQGAAAVAERAHDAYENGGYANKPYENEHHAAPALDPTHDLEQQSGFSNVDNNALLEPGVLPPAFERVQAPNGNINDSSQAWSAPNNQPMGYNQKPDSVALHEQETRPDAIAAARRALQATAAEMNSARDDVVRLEEENENEKEKSSSFLKSIDFSKLRKPLVLGAATLLLAALAWKTMGMFGGQETQTTAGLDVPAVERVEKPVENQQIIEQQQVLEAENTNTAVRVVGENKGEQTVDAASNANAANVASDNNGAVTPNDEANAALTTQEQKIANQDRVEPTLEEPALAAAPKAVVDVPASAGPAPLVAAAATGDSKALFQLGMRYSDGKDTTRDMVKAAKWFTMAADQGFAPAQYSLGSLYEKGIGVNADIKRAAQLYNSAAEQGNARAMHNLAVLYATGRPPEVQVDMTTAVNWFKKAAQLGIKDSQFNLGILYGQGMGVPQNLTESYQWFALAAKTGDTDAAKKRDEVANAMDPDDLADARTVVNNWAPAKLNEATNRVSIPEEWRGKSRTGANSNASTQKALVKKAQTLLTQRGFQVGTPDGLMGPKTKRAIMEFQNSAGIPATGVIDARTFKALSI